MPPPTGATEHPRNGDRPEVHPLPTNIPLKSNPRDVPSQHGLRPHLSWIGAEIMSVNQAVATAASHETTDYSHRTNLGGSSGQECH